MELHTYTGKVVREITRNRSLPKVASSIETSPELFNDRKQQQQERQITKAKYRLSILRDASNLTIVIKITKSRTADSACGSAMQCEHVI